jgi:hypothetical protein
MDLGTIKSRVDGILLVQRQWNETEEHFRDGAMPDFEPGQKFVIHLAYSATELALAVSEWFEVNLQDVKKGFDAVLAAQYDAELDGDNNGGREEIKHLKAQARAGQELAHAVAGWFDVQWAGINNE